jgi:hypothetical protein
VRSADVVGSRRNVLGATDRRPGTQLLVGYRTDSAERGWLRLTVGGARRRAPLRDNARTTGKAEGGLDRLGAGRRNLSLASLPAKDFALLEPHLKDIVLERSVLQEQGERIYQVYLPREGILSLLTVAR